MQIESLTPTMIGRHDKIYRFIQAYENRLETLANNGVIGTDYQDISKKIRTLKRVYKRASGWLLEKAYSIVREDFKRYPRTVKEHLILRGVHKNKYIQYKHNFENRFMYRVQVKNKQRVADEWEFKVQQSVLNAYEKGYYIVFDTLTLAQDHYYEFFGKGSTMWRDYITRLKRSTTGFYEYFAVREYGEETGRQHLHVVHIFQNLPKGCTDPNTCRKIPNAKEIDYLKKYWIYGFSSPRAMRISTNDAYAKKGWRWPYDSRDKPLKVNGIGAVHGYITKYITKSLQDRTKKWRIKASRNFGKHRINNIILQMNNSELLCLTRLSRNASIKCNNQTLPPGVLKEVACSILIKRMNHRPKLRNFLIKQKKKVSLPYLLRSLTREIQIRNRTNSGEFPRISLISKLYARQNVVYSTRFYDMLYRLQQRFKEPIVCKIPIGSGPTQII